MVRLPDSPTSSRSPSPSGTIGDRARNTLLPLSVDSSATNMQYQPLGHHPSVWDKWLPLLRPRLSWRWILSSLIIAYVAYCFITWQPFFAHRLPKPTGPYPVGAIDIEAPLKKPRLVHDAKFKGSEENAFELETVLFTLYYPAEKVSSAKAKHYWVPKPIAATAEGYAKVAHISNFFTNTLFTGAMGVLVGGITIPAEVDVALAHNVSASASISDINQGQPALTSRSGDEGIPTIVFTHGFASSRTDYTHWASELASRGYVVAAIEHRDGSCPGSVIMSKTHNDKTRLHFTIDDVTSQSEPNMSTDDWKKAQLGFRQAEVEETVRVLRAINAGEGEEVYNANPRNEGVNLAEWRDRLNTAGMVLAGHSYGATGTLGALANHSSLSTSSTTSAEDLLPFIGAIALDPGKSSGRLNTDISVPLLVVHSNSWSASHSVFYGRPHFSVVHDLVADNNARGNPSWFMTSLGTSHPSVTDAPLLEPLLLSWTTGAKIDVYEGVRQYVHVCEDFMAFVYSYEKGERKGERRGLLKEKAEFPEYDEKLGWGKYKGQGEGWRKFWQVHVAPV